MYPKEHSNQSHSGGLEFFLSLSCAYCQEAPIDSSEIPSGPETQIVKQRAPSYAHQRLYPVWACQSTNNLFLPPAKHNMQPAPRESKR